MKVTICNVCENIISPFLFEYKDGDIVHIDIYQLYKEKILMLLQVNKKQI